MLSDCLVWTFSRLSLICEYILFKMKTIYCLHYIVMHIIVWLQHYMDLVFWVCYISGVMVLCGCCNVIWLYIGLLFSVRGWFYSNHIDIGINKLFNWFCANKLSLNSGKTKYIVIRQHSKQINLNRYTLSINGTPLTRIIMCWYFNCKFHILFECNK